MTNKIRVPDAKGLAEEHDAELAMQHRPEGFSDRFALGFTRLLRFCADIWWSPRPIRPMRMTFG